MVALLLGTLVALTISPAWIKAKGKPISEGIASLYKPWVWDGRYAGKWRVKPTRDDLVCAHRTLRFGTILRLSWKGGMGVCVVLDRGPWGFCERLKAGRHYSAQCPRGYRYRVTTKGRQLRGFYRGEIDATPAVHEMMGSRGWVRVKVERLPSLGRQRSVLRVKQGGDV